MAFACHNNSPLEKAQYNVGSSSSKKPYVMKPKALKKTVPVVAPIAIQVSYQNVSRQRNKDTLATPGTIILLPPRKSEGVIEKLLEHNIQGLHEIKRPMKWARQTSEIMPIHWLISHSIEDCFFLKGKI